jgi:uncharacterized OB-fold protein
VNIVNGDSAQYWAAAKEGRLLFQKCRSCGAVQFPPRYHCGECWADTIDWTESAGRGTIESFTIVHRAPIPSFQDKVPYAIVSVKMEEGVRMIANLLGDIEDVRIGEPVKVAFSFVEQQTIPQFRREPIPAAG